MPPKRKTRKTKVVRDPSAYATVSVPSRANRDSSSNANPGSAEAGAAATATAAAGDIEIVSERSALPPISAIFGAADSSSSDHELGENSEETLSGGDVAAWVSIDLAHRQAEARIDHELAIKERMPAKGPAVTLSDKSEQLVIDGIRSGDLALPLPEAGQLVAVKDWTRSTNFVFETLLKYKFDEGDIKTAMEATMGSGDILDLLAWLCFNVPADRLPVDMRDKFEFSPSSAAVGNVPGAPKDGSGAVDRKESDSLPDTSVVDNSDAALSPNPPNPAVIDAVAISIGGSNDAESDVLVHALENLGLGTYDEDEYESDEDPGAVHARRSVRFRAFGEWLDYLKTNNQHNRYQDQIRAVSNLMHKEKAVISVLEDDWLFDEAQATSEFEQLWPGYHDTLLDEIRAFKEHEELKLARGSCELSSASKPDQRARNNPAGEDCGAKAAKDIFEDSDSDGGSEIGLGFGFGDDDEELDAAGSPAMPVSDATPTRVIDTAAPAGWTGAPIKDILGEFVRRQDSQAAIKYSASSAGAGYTCTLSITWSLPSRASSQTSNVRDVPIEPAPVLASSGSVQSLHLPSSLLGKTRRDAENLSSLVFLYMQPDSSQISKRLPPTLRSEWDEWEAIRRQIDQERSSKLHDARSGFLHALRAQYEASVGAKSIRGSTTGHTKHEEAYKTGVYARRAIDVRAHKWTCNLVPERQKGSRWKEKYGRAQELLPSRKFRSEIVKGIAENQVLIVRGDTGCGKSTQIPQFVLEFLLAGSYMGGRIMCTQPRRISTMSIATRVSQELADPSVGSSNSLVGYQIRFNAQSADENVLVFCTTGVLLRALADDPLLQGVSCIICDEVQERTLELDYLLVVLRGLLGKRPDLRVILMSATIDTTIFSCYFDNCPVVEIPGRTFPVKGIFLENIVQRSEYTLDINSRYAVREPNHYGSGSSESHTLTISTKGGNSYQQTVDVTSDETHGSPLPAAEFKRDLACMDPGFVSPAAWSVVSRMRTDVVNLDLIHHLVGAICIKDTINSADFLHPSSQRDVPDGSILVFLPGIYEIRTLNATLSTDSDMAGKAIVIPLHSTFANEVEPNSNMTYTELAFAAPPKGKRKIVLATNVAETGITIPDVTIVIDSGMSNQAVWDKKRHITRLVTRPISKANVKQRRGRAGRVQEGLSLCLFTEKQYHQMAEFELPEMQRLPLVNLCLMTKTHGVGNIMRFLQQAMEPPPQSSVLQAVHELKEAGALDEEENLTPIGRHLCYLPLDLSAGKMLIVGALLNCLDPVLTMAASLSQNGSILITPYDPDARALAAAAHAKYRKALLLPYADDRQASDFLTILAAYADWKQHALKRDMTKQKLAEFCKRNWLSRDGLESLEDCREQYLRVLCDLGLVKINRQGENRDVPLRRIIRPVPSHRPPVRDGFTVVPKDANTNGDSINVIYAAVTAGLDHILMPTSNGGFEIGQTTVSRRVRGIGHAIQTADRERVSTRPITVDRKSAIAASDAPLAANNALVAATLSGTSDATFANTVTRVNLAAVVLFSRSLMYWPKAKQLTINRWIETRCYAKTASILILLRGLLEEIMEFKVTDPLRDLPANLSRWQDVIIRVLRSEGV